MSDYLTSFFGLFFSEQNQLLLMFASAFLSSTVLPGNSEVVFSTLLAQQSFGSFNYAFTLFGVATVGNSLGSLTTYAMARLLPEPHFNPNQKAAQWAIRQSRQYGVWALLLSWLPVVGDLLCGVAGWLRFNPWQSALFITLGKAARYGILWWSVATFFG